MAEIDQDDYRKYAVRTKTAGEWEDCSNWKQMSIATHVAHIHNALAALKKQAISRQLVTDECRLNAERLLVVWLSPNDWVEGFRYGNFAFTLDFDKLVRSKRAYWVGVMEYSPLACRILLTDKKRTDLKEYDPEPGDGPWWHDVKN